MKTKTISKGRTVIKEQGWRTLVIESDCDLSLRSNCVLISGVDVTETEIPISQIKSVIVASQMVNVSTALLTALGKSNVSVLLCDEKYNPAFELSSLSHNFSCAGRVFEQISWNDDEKSEVWKSIVELKIQKQIDVLKLLSIEVPEKLTEYLNSVQPFDCTNREGQASRVYFKALFGNGFLRHTTDDVNSALNYGYALILASFNRTLTIHGYNTAIGIKHCNKNNRFNLSCDLMEPFRPFVDLIVAQFEDSEFTKDSKRILIESLHNKISYNGKTFSLTDAIEQYTLDLLKFFENSDFLVKELIF